MKMMVKGFVCLFILFSCKQSTNIVGAKVSSYKDFGAFEASLDDNLLNSTLLVFRDSLSSHISCQDFQFMMMRKSQFKDTTTFTISVISPHFLSFLSLNEDSLFFVKNGDLNIFFTKDDYNVSTNVSFTHAIQKMDVTLSECESFIRLVKCKHFTASIKVNYVRKDIDFISFELDCID